MHEPENDFERTAHASEAAEAGRPPSAWHRRFLTSLGVACLLLWAGLAHLVWTDGWGSFLVVPATLAVVNTAMLAQFLVRLRAAGRAHPDGRRARRLGR